ncbi:hypothetical protein TSTA_097630 [Talaromyces stipitatus ATCC 10500]|uniref:Uncharacterized protein n=1 Tax=Talaromyces stipitatus (strain ATCC 10500 / CBS 375.48 / QM 6759 / NRRL 1006) TaxID=441959 RepID=B8MLZ5_TALSN|nr:uncharacterized protein TSTA_097630 [Talaromyces stipitatus ATCC 10500]EED13507.1 hypothetical protein TSTA_097630 [Talaromyces stipitatus ATCC 10500]
MSTLSNEPVPAPHQNISSNELSLALRLHGVLKEAVTEMIDFFCNTITPPAGPLDIFIEPAKSGLDPMQALLRWVIETQQPFTVVEHPTWKELLKSLNANCPIKTADTLQNRVQSEYSS